MSLGLKPKVSHEKLTVSSLYIKPRYAKVDDMMKSVMIPLTIAILLAASPAGVSVAQDQDRAYKATKAAGLLPYARIRRIAEKQIGGKIVSQKLVRTNMENWIYQLRIRKKDGRVAFAVINAKTGKILSVK